jgi:hypothetical protein
MGNGGRQAASLNGNTGGQASLRMRARMARLSFTQMGPAWLFLKAQ